MNWKKIYLSFFPTIKLKLRAYKKENRNLMAEAEVGLEHLVHDSTCFFLRLHVPSDEQQISGPEVHYFVFCFKAMVNSLQSQWTTLKLFAYICFERFDLPNRESSFHLCSRACSQLSSYILQSLQESRTKIRDFKVKDSFFEWDRQT